MIIVFFLQSVDFNVACEYDSNDLRPMQGHHDWVCSVQFSPDGGFLVSGSLDRTVRVWGI